MLSVRKPDALRIVLPKSRKVLVPGPVAISRPTVGCPVETGKLAAKLTAAWVCAPAAVRAWLISISTSWIDAWKPEIPISDTSPVALRAKKLAAPEAVFSAASGVIRASANLACETSRPIASDVSSAWVVGSTDAPAPKKIVTSEAPTSRMLAWPVWPFSVVTVCGSPFSKAMLPAT